MAGRKKRLPDDAKVVALSLGGRERIQLQIIETVRKKQGEDGETFSEIVSEAIRHYFACVIGMRPNQLVDLVYGEADSIAPKSLRFFFSYSSKDELLKRELQIHLEPLRRNHEISMWCDWEIMPDKVDVDEIDHQLESANVIVPLLSPDFLASQYCHREMERAYERHMACEALLMPVIVRSCDWQNTFFKNLQVLPKDGKPIRRWEDPDEGYLDAVGSIRRTVDAYLDGNHPMAPDHSFIGLTRGVSKVLPGKTIGRVA